MKEQTRALSIISGGLDSILATRIIMDQGVDVTAIHFTTPFFGSTVGNGVDPISRRMDEQYGIRAVSVDITESYIEMLSSPQYGYGKNFNPCVDCKILLFSTAREMMHDYNAGFIVTGEVLGQRPMSQRRDTLRIIERDSLTTGLLLRPLSARLLKPTIPETEGWVSREDLFGFSGRSRKPQIELASRLGITGYPAPAGGCCLTDPIISGRIRRLYGLKGRPERREVKLVQIGRPFHLGGDTILTIGRNEEENDLISTLADDGDLFIRMVDLPGPLGIIIGTPSEEEINRAMMIVAYYSKGRNMPKVNVSMGRRTKQWETVRNVSPAKQKDVEQMRL